MAALNSESGIPEEGGLIDGGQVEAKLRKLGCSLPGMVTHEKFPKPLHIGDGELVWYEDEVDDFIEYYKTMELETESSCGTSVRLQNISLSNASNITSYYKCEDSYFHKYFM